MLSRSPTSTTPPSLRQLAEDANAYLPLGSRQERIGNERYVLWLGEGNHPSHTTVVRLRLDAEQVAATVEEVRGLLRERGRGGATWEVGTSATPRDLGDRLQALGLVADDEPLSVGMVLTDEPPAAPAAVEARPVATFEEFRAATEIAWEAFAMPQAYRDEARARLRERWAERDERFGQFLAWIGGEAVATGSAIYGPGAVMLYGGATVPHARGRGAYRALVRARWSAGVARGTPALITQAGHMSRPILRRLGFAEVAENRIFRDDLETAQSEE